MLSFVSYKFGPQKNESRIHFDGTGISAVDLKREILLVNKFSKAIDFDLALYNQHGQEYKDDMTIIPRSSSVIARRLPATSPGRGGAAHYLVSSSRTGLSTSSRRLPSGLMSTRCNTHRHLEAAAASESSATSSMPVSLAPGEAARIAAMFAATEHQWEETQEKMSHAARRSFASKRGGAHRACSSHSHGLPHDHTPRPTPPGYVCYRCGQKGHWIQVCPTNNDREFDNRERFKRTTGIPRTFLKAAPQPTDGSLTTGVMITPDGSFVTAQPDDVSWQKQTARTKALTDADIRAKLPSDTSLACSL